jgi:hypothetical protein
MAATRDIDIYKGDTYIHELRLKDSSNTAINISTRAYTGQIRKKRNSDIVLLEFTTSITNGANGVVAFSLTPVQTATLSAGLYVYDFQEVNQSVVTTLVTGNVTVTGDVTRAS